MKCKINIISFFISIIIIITSNFLAINNQLIIPIIKDMNAYYIKIFFDKDKKKAEFAKINMNLDFTFIPLSQDYSSQNSENEIIEVDNKEFNTKLISTNYFYFEEEKKININNFKFYYIQKKDLDKSDINKENKMYNNMFYGQFGLSPKYEDNNLNILYILKEENIIDRMSFGIALGKNKDNNYLFFGKLNTNNNNIFKDKIYSHIISLDKKLIKKYNKWGTKIDALVLEKKNDLVKNSKHKYFAYFNLLEDRIFVPDKIMEYLISRIFNIYIKMNICFVTEYYDKKFINCRKKKIIEEKDNFPAIIFVIKNFGFKLTFEDLFIESLKENELIFIIQKNYYDIDTSIILLGSRFFKRYIMEFNFENYNIEFHSDYILPVINLEQIEDDFWRDLVRDYNKETEHYDSNYGDDEDNKSRQSENVDNNDKQGTELEKKDEYKNSNNENNIDNNNEKGGKIKIEFSYNILYKIFWIFFFVCIILVGIFVLIHFRKKFRIQKEEKYFNQPLNENNNN